VGWLTTNGEPTPFIHNARSGLTPLCLWRAERKEVGCLTTPVRAVLTARVCMQAMCMQLRDALSVGCIALCSGFVSLSKDKKETLKTLDDELRKSPILICMCLSNTHACVYTGNFCILVEAPKTPFGRPKKTSNSMLKVCHTLLQSTRRLYMQVFGQDLRSQRRCCCRPPARSHRAALLLHFRQVHWFPASDVNGTTPFHSVMARMQVGVAGCGGRARP
jgi:hypothetical protein